MIFNVTGEYMIVVGLTGGIGSGKSYVLNWFKEYAYIPTFEADKVAKDLMMPPHSIYKDVVKEFGDSILSSDETVKEGDEIYPLIDREALRRIVMNDEEALARLNSIVHPGVKKFFKDYIASDVSDIVIIESAILLQDGYDEICDEIWYVRANADIRCERIMKSRGYSYEKAQSFMKNQPGDDYYLEHADLVIDNSDDEKPESLSNQLKSVLENFLSKYGFRG